MLSASNPRSDRISASLRWPLECSNKESSIAETSSWAEGELSWCMFQLCATSQSSKSSNDMWPCRCAINFFLTSDSFIMAPPITVRIDVWEMRCKFNRGKYWSRLQSGELTANYTKSKHPAPPSSGQPHCTHSQDVSYLDSKGQEVARVHQYLLPDQTLGGGGKPDPKRLREGNIVYRLPQKPKDDPSEPVQPVVLAGLRLQVMKIWGPIRCRVFGR